MLYLALGTEVGKNSTLFLVAPDNRRDEVEQQLCRPAFSRASELNIRYLPVQPIEGASPTDCPIRCRYQAADGNFTAASEKDAGELDVDDGFRLCNNL